MVATTNAWKLEIAHSSQMNEIAFLKFIHRVIAFSSHLAQGEAINQPKSF
jgi:hypothetical protein